MKAICHFDKDMLGVKESTVRGWKTTYSCELVIKVKAGEDLSVKQFPEVKGWPLLLGGGSSGLSLFDSTLRCWRRC